MCRERIRAGMEAVEGKQVSQPNLVGGAEMSARMWAMVVLTGVLAGVTSGLLMKLLRLVQHVSYAYSSGDFLDGVKRSPGGRRVLIMVLAGIVGGVALYLLRRVTGGTGGEITGAIWHDYGRFAAAPTVVKSVISIVVVGMGAAVGREAALKDMGAVVAGKLSDWSRLTEDERHLLVACGAGAGMAAAYNVPLGGALFATEVLLGSMSLGTVIVAIVTSFLAVAVSWLMLPNAPTFVVAPLALSPSLLLWAAITGVVIGAASAVYVKFIRWAETDRPRRWGAAVAPVVVFAGLGLLSIRFPEILGNGKGVVQEAFGSRLGPVLLGSLLVLRPLATALCLKSGVPGGLFTPTMTFGALLGGLMGEGWSMLRQAISKDSYAIIGAGAMLAAASQGPISSVVFMLELTNHTDTLIVPLMIAAGLSTIVARRIDEGSIYSVRG